MSLHLKLLDIDQPLTFEESKLWQIEAHALIYLSRDNLPRNASFWQVGLLDVALSEYPDKSHNFTNLHLTLTIFHF